LKLTSYIRDARFSDTRLMHTQTVQSHTKSKAIKALTFSVGYFIKPASLFQKLILFSYRFVKLILFSYRFVRSACKSF